MTGKLIPKNSKYYHWPDENIYRLYFGTNKKYICIHASFYTAVPGEVSYKPWIGYFKSDSLIRLKNFSGLMNRFEFQFLNER
jgi:hypothetical protein